MQLYGWNNLLRTRYTNILRLNIHVTSSVQEIRVLDLEATFVHFSFNLVSNSPVLDLP